MDPVDGDRVGADSGGGQPRLPALVAGWVGLLSLVAALAAGHLVAALVDPGASPYLAVGNTAIDMAPAWLKDFAISTFGTYDKPVLLAGMAVVLAGLGVLAGLASRRGPVPGAVVALVLGVVGLLAVLYRPDLGELAILSPLASLLVGLVAFRWLHELAVLAVRSRDATPGAQGGADRRTFLRASAGLAAGAGVAGVAGQLLAARVDVEGSRSAVGAIVPATPPPPLPPGADFAASGTPRFITSNRDFYRIDTALVVPKLRAQEWTLRVHGLVDRELTLSYEDIRRRPLVASTVTLTCVSNEVGGGYVSTAEFVGVPLRDLLLDAGVRPGCDQLYSSSVDGFTAGTPIADVLDPNRGALLAIGMNGEPLPVEHGFPARMVVPGLYGYVSATKWLTELELTTFEARQGYWVPRGWAARAPIKTQSRIDNPADGASVEPGRVTVAGVAWAQHTGIDRVEVRVDDGPWREAELSTEVSIDTWRMWRTQLELSPGRYVLRCRATDRSGHTQTEQQAPPVPDGATGWHSVAVTVEG